MDMKNKKFIKGANPYMPLWEHVPDGEPRVFTYNGETRVYVYGSHDVLRTEYCGADQVVWSAPADDLTDWKCHGVCFSTPDGEPLYAPDVVQKGDTFYMYAAPNRGSKVVVAESKNPAGPFVNPRETEIGFDPGVLVDDDGRVYVYWGFLSTYCAELESDMATIKPGTLKAHVIPHCRECQGFEVEQEHIDEEFSFFEASSLRKIGDKYIYIYSRRQSDPVPEEGLAASTNGYLVYAYSDSPLGGWKYGGVISNNAGDIVTASDGTKKRAYPTGNNHGSIIEVNGKWYVFYHRMIGTDEFARQAMLEPIEVEIGKDGRVYIGKIVRDENGEPIAAHEAEMTSQGAHINGLDARCIIQAGYACHLTSETEGTTALTQSSKGAYIKPVYDKEEGVVSPILGIKNGTVAGFKYINFGETAPKELYVALRNVVDGAEITVRTENELAAKIVTEEGKREYSVPVLSELRGRRKLFFEFKYKNEKADICEFESFTFE